MFCSMISTFLFPISIFFILCLDLICSFTLVLFPLPS
jgi:hypothetical protein